MDENTNSTPIMIAMDETVVVQPKKTKEHERQYSPKRAVKMKEFILPGQLSLATQLSLNLNLLSLNRPSVIEASYTTKQWSENEGEELAGADWESGSGFAFESVLVACMTRKRSSSSLHPFDPEIDKTFDRVRKSKNMLVGHSSRSFSSISESDNFEIKPDIVDNLLLGKQCTLVDQILNILAIVGEPSPLFHGDCCGRQKPLNPRLSLVRFRCVHPKPSQSNSVASESARSQDRVRSVSAETMSGPSLPRLDQISLYREPVGILHLSTTKNKLINELKSKLIHLLPKFHSLVGEDLQTHLKEFHDETARDPKDYIKMKAFPFSLDGVAKDWLYLQPNADYDLDRANLGQKRLRLGLGLRRQTIMELDSTRTQLLK
ncbi:hypothetical protein CR513_18730, partial [Mucuna pruriens]